MEQNVQRAFLWITLAFALLIHCGWGWDVPFESILADLHGAEARHRLKALTVLDCRDVYDFVSAEQIRPALQDRDKQIRIYAVRVLRKIGDVRVAPDLARAGQEEFLRKEVLKTLIHFDHPALISWLQGYTRDPNPEIRERANEAVRRLSRFTDSWIARHPADPYLYSRADLFPKLEGGD